MTPQTLICLDLETAGLNEHKHQITQIGAIAVEWTPPELPELGRFEVKVTLYRDAEGNLTHGDPSALEKNSYDEETWKREAVSWPTALERFEHFVNQHRTKRKISHAGNPYYVANAGGFNISGFDRRFLEAAWGRAHDSRTGKKGRFLPMDTYGAGCHDVMWLAKSIAMARGKDFDSYALEDLCKEFLIPHNAHDAFGDVEATLELQRLFLRMMREGVGLAP